MLSFLISTGTTTSVTKTGTTTLVPKGIPGLEKIGQLAKELLSLADIGVSTAQASERFKVLHIILELYDKKAIEVHFRLQKPNLRGCICHQKSSGHTTREQMRKL